MEAIGDVIKQHHQAATQTKTQRPTQRLYEGAKRNAAELHENAAWDSVAEKLRLQVEQAIREDAWPIYLCGDTGRGKTYAMSALYRAWPSLHVRWIDLQPWLNLLMRCRREGVVSRCVGDVAYEVTEGTLWHQVREASLLCIDDCGVRADSHAQTEAFLELLNVRARRPTVITGNHKAEKLTQIFDSRVASRLMTGRLLELHGCDRRLAAGELVEVDV